MPRLWRRRISISSSVNTTRSATPTGMRIPDYLIDEEKLGSRLARIYGVQKSELETTWTMGNYYILVREQPPRDLEKVSMLRTVIPKTAIDLK